jgi:hypothetical protein
MLAVLLVVCPWAARGQYMPPQDNAGWRQAADEGRRATEDWQREQQARDEVLRREAAIAIAYNNTNGPQAQRTSQLLRWWGAALIGAAVLVVLSLVTRAILGRWATTDPEKLALSDPWVRAHLDQMKAAQAGEPPPRGGQETP